MVTAFLTLGFRPFFLAAGLWSAAALALWIAMLVVGAAVPSRFDPLAWHIHEMLFGFVMAAIAGFLLTAIPNWTGRPAVSGLPLATLAGLWLLGRVACLESALVPAWLAIAADLAFPSLFVAIAAREIIVGRNWRNLPLIAPIAVLGAANLVMHLETQGIILSAGLGWRLGLSGIVVLISVVAGRIVPSFTRNWLARRAEPHAGHLPPSHGWIDRGALGFLHAGMLGWAILPDFRPFGLILVLGAALNFWRLFRWRGGATFAEPLLFVLHVGYAWLALGALLLGLAALGADVPQSAAIHALTAGAIGTMTLAVITRVALGHTGRPLAADRATALIYVLVNLAAALRIAAVVGDAWATALLVASASLWIGAFGLFVIGYGPMLLRPRRPSRPG